MPATGYIKVRAYTSVAQYPLKDVAITITAADGTAIAMSLTDRNGLIRPIPIPVPDKSESQTPDPPEQPYATVNLPPFVTVFPRPCWMLLPRQPAV